MTHSDIKTKFLIEYDKADITSSYPSLTDYEIATILDKSYLALINQKLTGNNPRQIGFEGDNKAIEDVQRLIKTNNVELSNMSVYSHNDAVYNIPEDFLYYVQSKMNLGYTHNGNTTYSSVEVELASHKVAEKYMCTTHNDPWVETPVCYIEDGKIIALTDPHLHIPGELTLTYVRKFNKFVTPNGADFGDTLFELSDSMAEELINLAIIFAAETVESPRTSVKSNIRPIES